MSTRRDLITLLGSAATWPLAARAQQPAMPVIGVLDGGGTFSQFEAAFRRGLADGGHVEGRNLTFEFRSADGQYDRLPGLAADLVRHRAAVIGTATPVAALAAKAATAMIPIVFFLGSDPIKDGLVASLNRPGGNVTGVTWFTNVLAAKRLELFHALVPEAAAIAVLLNPSNANAVSELNETEAAARTLGRRIIVARADTEPRLDAALASLVEQRAIALFVSGDAYLNAKSGQIVALATRHSIPTSFGQAESARIGGLMSYGASRSDLARQFGAYVGRVLKGEKPGDLPVMQPTRFELVINLKTAKALGFAVPDTLLVRADEVIE